ncbi:hypothetical protein GQ457_05G017940 [Hibiscus cannabinus]
MHIGGLKCVGGSGIVRIGFPVLLERVLIASLGEGKEARRIHLDLCSSTVFGNYGSMTKQWGGLPYLGAC